MATWTVTVKSLSGEIPIEINSNNTISSLKDKWKEMANSNASKRLIKMTDPRNEQIMENHKKISELFKENDEKDIIVFVDSIPQKLINIYERILQPVQLSPAKFPFTDSVKCIVNDPTHITPPYGSSLLTNPQQITGSYNIDIQNVFKTDRTHKFVLKYPTKFSNKRFTLLYLPIYENGTFTNTYMEFACGPESNWDKTMPLHCIRQYYLLAELSKHDNSFSARNSRTIYLPLNVLYALIENGVKIYYKNNVKTDIVMDANMPKLDVETSITAKDRENGIILLDDYPKYVETAMMTIPNNDPINLLDYSNMMPMMGGKRTKRNTRRNRRTRNRKTSRR